MMDERFYRPKIREITLELKCTHQMEIVEEAWKLFNWAHDEKLMKQKKLADY
ncbi:MAG: hypothetical protein ACP5OJ_06520 [Methanothermobacter sp.]